MVINLLGLCFNITKKLVLFFATLLILYFYLVYPNDSRVRAIDLARLQKPSETISKHSGAFTHYWPIALQSEESLYKERIKTLENFYPNHITTQSIRFENPFHSFISLGSYPDGLDGRKALIIPAGISFSLKLPFLTEEAFLSYSFSSIAKKDMTLIFKMNAQSWEEDIEKQKPARVFGEIFYNYIGRYLFPDAKVPGSEFLSSQQHDISSSQSASNLEISCKGDDPNGYCIVADLDIFERKPALKQNVLFILVDTLRYDAIDAGSAPFLFDFSKRSLAFKNNIAPGNMTSPSTNSILSCMHPSLLGDVAFSYATTHEMLEKHYEKNMPSFPYFFSKAGYQTGMIGNVSVISDTIGIALDHGFNHQIAIEQPGYDTPHITKKAIQWLEEQGQKPFFLYLHYHAPHAPYRAPLADIVRTFPGTQVFAGAGSVLKWLYQAEVSYTDRYIKQVFEALDVLGLKENTLVILTADHGDHHELRRFTENIAGPIQTGGFFDHGATLYLDEIRTPLILSVPGSKPHTVEDWVSGYDIGPTLLALNGLPIPKWCSGRDLSEYLQDPVSKRSHYRTIVSEGFDGRSLLWKGRYKYTRYHSPTNKRFYAPSHIKSFPYVFFTEEELYDLETDPLETKNLIKNKALRDQSLRIFREFFNIQTGYELIVENPKKKTVLIETDEKTFAAKTFESDQALIVLPIDPHAGSFVQVKVDHQLLPSGLTSSRFGTPHPFQSLDAMTLEWGIDANLLPKSLEASAYIRKIEKTPPPARDMITGNQDFQKILQEWGYLNEG